MTAKKARRSPWRVVRRVVGGALVLALVVVAGVVTWRLVGPAPDSWEAMDDLDHEVLTQLAEQYEVTAPDPAAIWTASYRYEDQPVVLLHVARTGALDWSYAILVNMSDVVDTSGMAHVTVPDAPLLDDVVVSKRFGVGDWTAHLPGNFSTMQVDGVEVLAMRYTDELLADRPGNGQSFQAFLLHENFHVTVQGVEVAPRSGPLWQFSDGGFLADYPHTDDHRSLLRAELSVLDEMNATTDPIELRSLATDFAVLRQERLARWPQLAPTNDIEAVEGSATYVEKRYDIAGDVAAKPAISFVEALDTYWDDPEQQRLWTRDLMYSTGAFLELALDRLDVDWKTAVEPAPVGSSTTPFDSLAAAVGVEGRPDPATLQAVLDRHP